MNINENDITYGIIHIFTIRNLHTTKQVLHKVVQKNLIAASTHELRVENLHVLMCLMAENI